MSIQLDHDELHKLLAVLADSDIQEFRLEGEDFRLEIKRNLPLANQEIQSLPEKEQQISSSQALVGDSPAPQIPSSPPPKVAGTRADLAEITAPMVGTFYIAPAPGDPPFIEVGSKINVGQTVCILEAMKLMNELESEIGGDVVEILVENGTPVEFGQVLIRVKPN
tara:strand:- start:1187 stop:1684 length:498 start_codon:yes stop_codon:yes gene_type:complete